MRQLRASPAEGWPEMELFVFNCADCAEETFLGPVMVSEGFGQVYDVELLRRLIVGDPPRCAECRTRRGSP